ncbi:hypothetical protein [Georgenia sp. Marseille-Q6866]
MITRRDAAQRLDIPVEMATRHGLPPKLTAGQLREIEDNPPPWLVQSRANRTGKAVWVDLVCTVCGYTEKSRPKKWWPRFTHISCDDHRPGDLPPPLPGHGREEIVGIGSRFVGVVDTPLD